MSFRRRTRKGRASYRYEVLEDQGALEIVDERHGAAHDRAQLGVGGRDGLRGRARLQAANHDVVLEQKQNALAKSVVRVDHVECVLDGWSV